MRILAVLSAAVVLLGLCACGGTGTSPETPVTRATALYPTDAFGESDFSGMDAVTTTEDESARAYRGGVWDEELLPNEFPSPVAVAQEISTLHDTASYLLGEQPCEAWVLSIALTAAQWDDLCDAFADAGWNGGGSDLTATHATTADGAWVGTRHYAYVYHSEYDEGTWLYTVQIAVFLQKAQAFPDALAANFPAFTAGYTHPGGSMTAADGVQRWSFGGAGRFVGVTAQEQEAYQQALRQQGFAVTATADGWVAAADTRQAQAVFDPVCRTLELVYTVMSE